MNTPIMERYMKATGNTKRYVFAPSELPIINHTRLRKRFICTTLLSVLSFFTGWSMSAM